MIKRTWHTCQPADLLKLARRRFLHDRRIELQRLSQELGISRATAYRWVGNAEHLSGLVLASIADDTFSRAVGETDSEGTERVLDVIERVMKYARSFLPLRHFLAHNPQMGLKIVASQDSAVRKHTIDHLQAILEEEAENGRLSLRTDARELATALTRVMETFLYTDMITGDTPDIDRARSMSELLLHGSDRQVAV